MNGNVSFSLTSTIIPYFFEKYKYKELKICKQIPSYVHIFKNGEDFS